MKALSVTDPQEYFIQTFYLIKCITKFDMTDVEEDTGIICSSPIQLIFFCVSGYINLTKGK
jgi:hypothetical protein